MTSIAHSLTAAPVENASPRVIDLDLSGATGPLYKQWCDMHLYWLNQHDVMEEADKVALSNPQASIYGHGGKIMGIVVEQKLVASIAVLPLGGLDKLRWEIVKFAVLPEYQGKGMGGILLRSAIAYCTKCMREVAKRQHDPAATKGVIQLDSNAKLTSAVRMYESHGFKPLTDYVKKYLTVDVFMELEVDLTDRDCIDQTAESVGTVTACSSSTDTGIGATAEHKTLDQR